VVVRPARGAPVGRPVAGAIRRSATIRRSGSTVGQVTAFVPLDLRLLQGIERAADARAGVVLGLARKGALVAAPGSMRGARLSVPLGSTAEATIAGARYRAAAVEIVGGRSPTQLVALVPKPLVDSAGSRRRRILVAAVATLATAALLLLAVLQVLRLRRRSHETERDRRRSLGPRSARAGLAGGRDALA